MLIFIFILYCQYENKLLSLFYCQLLLLLLLITIFLSVESLGLSDQMDWFRSYYQQAEHSIPSLLQIR